jgi:hypothetical protein
MADRYFEDYLGDGAYVYMEAWGDVVLYTSNGITETNTVALGPAEMAAFKNWVERAQAERKRLLEERAKKDG